MLSLNETKWNIIKELSNKNRTPSELSKKLKLTLPSIYIALKELVKDKLVKKIGKIKGKTRNYDEYSIENGFIYFIKVLPGSTDKRFLSITPNINVHLNIWSIPQEEYHEYIQSFWWSIQKYIFDIDAVIVYGSVATGNAVDESDIDILILVKKNTQKYEKLFKVNRIELNGKSKIIMAEIFNIQDFLNSTKKGSSFAKEIIKKGIILYDNNNYFKNLKNGP